MIISELYKNKLQKLAGIVTETIIATHVTPRYDSDNIAYNKNDFDAGFFGNRIFKTPKTKVTPVWFSELDWDYAIGHEMKKITAELDVKNFFDPRIKRQRDNLEKYAVKTYGKKYLGLSESISNGDWSEIEEGYDSSIPALIKEMGYDSYISFENGKKSYAVFDKKNIKIINHEA